MYLTARIALGIEGGHTGTALVRPGEMAAAVTSLQENLNL